MTYMDVGSLQSPEERMLTNAKLVDGSLDKVAAASAPGQVRSSVDGAIALLSEQALLARAVAGL